MTSWMKNQIANLFNAVSGQVASTRDALEESLQNVHDTTYFKEMYKRNVEREPLIFKYVSEQNKTQVMCERAVAEEPERLKYFSNKDTRDMSKGCLEKPRCLNMFLIKIRYKRCVKELF